MVGAQALYWVRMRFRANCGLWVSFSTELCGYRVGEGLQNWTHAEL